MGTERNESPIISYYTLRGLIGVLGIAFPLTVVIGGFIQNQYVVADSISSYYYTNMRDYFVGLLCGFGFFLSTYKGYERIDNIVTTLSGLFAFGIITFPTSFFDGRIQKVGMFQIDSNISGVFHMTFSTLFFLFLAYNSYFLFTKQGDEKITKEKKTRNKIYRICGVIMLISVICIAIYVVFLMNTFISKVKPILIFESIALFSFGVSWLVKGNTIFREETK
jgi:hypothetical protein